MEKIQIRKCHQFGYLSFFFKSQQLFFGEFARTQHIISATQTPRNLFFQMRNFWQYATPFHLFILWQSHSYTLQRKSHLCVPRKGLARPQSQFPHSCVCERFIFPGLIHIFSCRRICKLIVGIYCINHSQTHECGNWDWGRTIPFLGIFGSVIRNCVFAVLTFIQLYSQRSTKIVNYDICLLFYWLFILFLRVIKEPYFC